MCRICFAQVQDKQSPGIPAELTALAQEETVKKGINEVEIRNYVMVGEKKIILQKQSVGYESVIVILNNIDKAIAQWNDQKWIDARKAELDDLKNRYLAIKAKFENKDEPIEPEK